MLFLEKLEYSEYNAITSLSFNHQVRLVYIVQGFRKKRGVQIELCTQ